MEFHVVMVKALIATDAIFEAHWTLSHTDGGFTVTRYGSVAVPPSPSPLLFATVTENDAILRVQEILGPAAVAALEASITAELAEAVTPTIVQGTPWAP